MHSDAPESKLQWRLISFSVVKKNFGTWVFAFLLVGSLGIMNFLRGFTEPGLLALTTFIALVTLLATLVTSALEDSMWILVHLQRWLPFVYVASLLLASFFCPLLTRACWWRLVKTHPFGLPSCDQCCVARLKANEQGHNLLLVFHCRSKSCQLISYLLHARQIILNWLSLPQLGGKVLSLEQQLNFGQSIFSRLTFKSHPQIFWCCACWHEIE